MNRLLRRKIILSSIACSALFMSIYSLAADSEYEQWRKKTQTEFQNYLDENDKAFIGFLNKKWQEVDVEKTVTRDPAPKPLVIPVAKPVVTIKDMDTKKFGIEKLDTEDIKKEIIKPVLIKPIPIVKSPVVIPTIDVKKDFNLQSAKFDFFGEQINIAYDKNFKQDFSRRISNKSIANYWQKLATQPHKKIIVQLSETAKNLQLNDWGTALLFDQFARELQGSNQRNQSSRQLMSWFLLVKAGFNARIAYNEQVFLLMPSQQQLFSTTYFTLDNQRYYSVSLNEKEMKPGKVFTYSGKHINGQRNLDFSEPNKFIANKNQEKRNFYFSYNDEKFDINVSFPKDMVNYFKTFPQLELKNYFSAGMPQETAYSLLTQLKPIIENQTEIEAVNRLLRFVQTGFKYKTDEDQFRQENYLFPLETLYYPYSDCEDRAALFAWLAQSLLTLEVVIVDFPGHIATAVEFSKPVQGDSWQLNGKRYTIADPTYVNANVGMTMPQFIGKTPKLIAF
ncbi:MAG: hypothetical protein ACI9DG_001698 [Oleispira sp.]|jgi:hypothetical protein